MDYKEYCCSSLEGMKAWIRIVAVEKEIDRWANKGRLCLIERWVLTLDPYVVREGSEMA